MKARSAAPLWFSLLLAACAGAPGATGGRADADAVRARNPGLGDAAVLYVHGAGDGPGTWAEAVAAERGGLALDWAPEAADRMGASERGYRIGRELASGLEAGDRVIYAHSAGAWLAQGLADGLAARGVPGRIGLVFLDPFTALSLARPFAGARLLGVNAASASTYWTGADPIPFTRGGVARGSVTEVDGRPGPAFEGRDAHWALVAWYFSAHRGPPAP